ncbi:MAG: hypothetical protein WC054_04360 [Candidatus Nanopelagicales bacterium]
MKPKNVSSAAGANARATDRGLTVCAFVVVLAWAPQIYLAAIAATSGSIRTLQFALIGAQVVVMIAALLRWLRPSVSAILLIATAIGISANCSTDDWLAVSILTTSMQGMVAAVTGFVAPARRAPAMIVAVVAAVSCAWVLELVALDAPHDFYNAAAFGAIRAVCTALTIFWAVHAIRLIAHRQDRLDEAYYRAKVSEEVERGRSERAFEFARVLHDTVVNTLAAINIGVRDRSIPRLRERCRADVVAIESLDALVPSGQRPTSSATLVGNFSRRAAVLGVPLEMSDASSPMLLPHEVWEALLGAGSEALNNTARHAAGASAKITFETTDGVVRLAYADDGPGLPVGALEASGGLQNSIVSRCERAGISVDLGQPKDGFHVTLTWRSDADAVPDAIAPDSPSAVPLVGDVLTSSAAKKTAVVTMAGSALHVVIGLPISTASSNIANLAALAVFLAAGAFYVHTVNRGAPLPSTIARLTIVATAFAVPALASVNASPDQLKVMWFGQFAVSAILAWVALTVTHLRWLFVTWVAGIAGTATGLAAAEFSASPEALALLFVKGNVITLAGWLTFRVFANRFAHKADLARTEVTGAAVAASESASATEHITQRVNWVRSCVSPFLQDVAESRRDPQTPDSRSRALTLEGLARQVSELRPLNTDAESLLLAALTAAATHNVGLTIGSLDESALVDRVDDDLTTTVAAIIAAAARTPDLVMSAYTEGEGARVSLAATGPAPVGLDQFAAPRVELIVDDDGWTIDVYPANELVKAT